MEHTGRLVKIQAIWKLFENAFPTTEACIEVLASSIGARCPPCHFCGFEKNQWGYGMRRLQCMSCKRWLWRLRDTIFHGIKRPRLWLGAIFLFASGETISATDLQRVSGSAYSTALAIVHKLSMVMVSGIGQGTHQIPTSALASIIRKRSLDTAERQSPQEEVNSLEEKQAQINALSTIASADLPKHQQPLYALLDCKKPVHFDVLLESLTLTIGELCETLVELELKGWIVRQYGDFYIRKPHWQTKDSLPHALPRAQTAKEIEYVCNFVQQYFQGISRRYLQLYAAMYWFTSVAKWNFPTFLRMCASCRRISSAEMRSFTSAFWIKT